MRMSVNSKIWNTRNWANIPKYSYIRSPLAPPSCAFDFEQVKHFRCENQLENVAIATHCHLRSPDASPVVRFNHNAHSKVQDGQPIRCYLVVFLRWYVTLHCDLDLWPRDLDLWHIDLGQCIGCDVVELCTKFERNRTTCGGVIAISLFDLMTLNMCHVLCYVLL